MLTNNKKIIDTRLCVCFALLLPLRKFQEKGNMNQTRQKSMHAAGNLDSKDPFPSAVFMHTLDSHLMRECPGTKLSLLVCVVGATA